MTTTILLVDDHKILLDGLRSLIEFNHDFEVVGEASNGVEAVEKYKELTPDLVTMDIVMPFKSGIEATREIIAHDKDATVVMCSALGQESLVIEAIEAGAADFVVKPFAADRVLAAVKKILT